MSSINLLKELPGIGPEDLQQTYADALTPLVNEKEPICDLVTKAILYPLQLIANFFRAVYNYFFTKTAHQEFDEKFPARKLERSMDDFQIGLGKKQQFFFGTKEECDISNTLQDAKFLKKIFAESNFFVSSKKIEKSQDDFIINANKNSNKKKATISRTKDDLDLPELDDKKVSKSYQELLVGRELNKMREAREKMTINRRSTPIDDQALSATGFNRSFFNRAGVSEE